MNGRTIAAALLGVAVSTGAGAAALAEDNEAGVPLTPAEAAGAWTVETAGHSVCTVTLSATKSGAGYAAKADSCGDAIPGQVAAWQTTRDGMQLVSADGQPVIKFNRWSNSLFVSHRTSGVDIQLRRGAPAPG
jgi:hypothetical protein